MSVKFRDLLFGTLEGTGSLKLDTVKSFFVIGLAASIAYQGKTRSFSEFSAYFDSFRINSCHQPVPKKRQEWTKPDVEPTKLKTFSYRSCSNKYLHLRSLPLVASRELSSHGVVAGLLAHVLGGLELVRVDRTAAAAALLRQDVFHLLKTEEQLACSILRE